MRQRFIIERILDVLQDGTETTLNLLDVFFSGYSDSYKKARSYMLHGSPQRFSKRWADIYKEKNRFYSLLSKLKKEGLVEKEKKNKTIKWRITKRGLAKLHNLKEKKKFFSATINYQQQADSNFKVISFDVPERERNKRSWLRAALADLGFSILQQSLWIGKRKIPAKFLKDLEERKMLSYVNIFEVNKRGTIREVT